MKVLSKIWNELLYYIKVKSNFSNVNKSPIILFGNQKSGTSAISALLARHGGLTLTLDFKVRRYVYNDFYRVVKRTKSVDSFCEQYSYLFSNDIIKEPNLTLLMPEMCEKFPDAKKIFIVREPLENIRSILERLGLSSVYDKSDLGRVNFVWENILLGGDLEEKSNEDCLVLNLAFRWLRMAKMALDLHQVKIIRYEDFNQNKLQFIEELADSVGVFRKADVSEFVDYQYQPKGAGQSVNSFFSPQLKEQILDVVGDTALEFGYKYE